MSPQRQNEAAQRRALARYAVLDTPRNSDFDELADLARTLAGTQAAGIGFLDHDRLWFKATVGFDADELSRNEFPVCRPTGPALGGDEPGAERAVITSRVPFVVAGQPFGFCASAPIGTSEGYLIGELFVFASGPRELSEPQATGLLALARQVQARLELRRTELSYHAVVGGVGHVVFQLDESHRLVSLTPTWSTLTGFGPVRSVGQSLLSFVHPDDRAQVTERLSELAQGENAQAFECRLLRLLGDDLPTEIIARPLVDEAGGLRGLVGVIADISERKARAVEAQHAQKLEALGRLSAGLAHEINTPIQFVGDNARFLLSAYRALAELIDTYRDVLAPMPAQPLTEHALERIRRAEQESDIDYLAEEIPTALQQSLEGVERVSTLVRAMRTFSRAGQERQAPADLNEALQSAVIVSRNQISEVADIAVELSALPLVTCSIGDLNQVFLNLLVNAADAIADKGERGLITISSRLDGEHAVVTVTDTGTGIPQQVRQRIFEPFFTTKEVGRGTGQGLALARAVVHDKHQGSISVESELGRGASFTIRLPISGRTGLTG